MAQRKTIEFYPKKGEYHDTLKIETHGCVINISVNLKNTDGQKVTNISIRSDGRTDTGEDWQVTEVTQQPHYIGALIVEKLEDRDASSSDL